MSEAPKHPMQPLVRDVDGVLRFKKNGIVSHLLELARLRGVTDLNQLACGDFSREDWSQFMQLIGYSVSGFGDLSIVDPAVVEEADRLADEMRTSPR